MFQRPQFGVRNLFQAIGFDSINLYEVANCICTILESSVGIKDIHYKLSRFQCQTLYTLFRVCLIRGLIFGNYRYQILEIYNPTKRWNSTHKRKSLYPSLHHIENIIDSAGFRITLPPPFLRTIAKFCHFARYQYYLLLKRN